MITTGIIKEINATKDGNVGDAYLYSVEIAIFKTPIDTDSDSCTMICSACVMGGVSSCYDVGDKVYVGFINNEQGLPVILGRILTKSTYERGFYNTKDLSVADSATLPTSTTIGKLKYSDLLAMYQRVSNITDDKLHNYNIFVAFSSGYSIYFDTRNEDIYDEARKYSSEKESKYFESFMAKNYSYQDYLDYGKIFKIVGSGEVRICGIVYNKDSSLLSGIGYYAIPDTSISITKVRRSSVTPISIGTVIDMNGWDIV